MTGFCKHTRITNHFVHGKTKYIQALGTESRIEERIQAPVLVTETIVPSQREVRRRTSEYHTVGRRVRTSGNTSIRGIIGIVPVGINTRPTIAIEGADGFALGNDVGTVIANARHHTAIETRFLCGKLHHLVLQVSTIDRSAPIKIVGRKHVGTDGKVNPPIGDFPGINQIGSTSQIVRQTSRKQGVGRTLVEIVKTQGQTIVPQAQIETDIELVGFLPLDVRSGQCVLPITCHTGIATEIGRGLTHQGQGRIRSNVLITNHPIAGTKFQMIDDIPIRFHELLIGSRPGKSNRREIAPLVIGKSAGAIGTERTRNHVSIIVVIDDTTYSREHRPIRIAIGGISGKCIVHIPPTYGLHLNVLSIDTHRAGIAGGGFPYGGSGQVMLVIPNFVVSKVIGRLEQDTLRIAIAHAIATIAIDFQW